MAGERDGLPAGALLLDLDGVLVDSQAVVERTWRRWAEMHGLDAARILAQAHGCPSRQTVASVAPGLDVEAEVATLLEWELADLDGLRAVPGAAAFVAQVAPLPWAVVTSGHRALAERRLRTVGLAIPEVLVAAEDVSAGKPDPEPYLRAAEALGVAPSTAVVVEDSPAGVAAGLAAGMRVVALTTTHDREAVQAATMVLPDLAAARIRHDEESGVSVIGQSAPRRPGR